MTAITFPAVEDTLSTYSNYLIVSYDITYEYEEIISVTKLNIICLYVSLSLFQLTFPKTKEKKLITSSVFVIATGSSPKIPSYIQGLKEYCITADCLFRRRSEPGKTLVLAATHFGLECATILANLKREVTVLVRSISEQILNNFPYIYACEISPWEGV